jgi:maleylpyruvate isomerase
VDLRDPSAIGAVLDEMALATDRLLATVDGMDDAALREPSLLPGWTRAHVLTHVARNADGLANLVQWARTGEEIPMYAGGRAGRDADIEAGATRHIGDIRLDVADSAERLLGAFAGLDADALAREVRLMSGELPARELPGVRTREVEVHHVDLGAGYSPAHWPADFVVRTLDQLAPLFHAERDCPVAVLQATDAEASWRVAADGPTLSGPRNALLAWLTGRSRGDGLELDGGGPVPSAPTWR